MRDLGNCEKSLKNYSGCTGIRTHELCDTSAVLYQRRVRHTLLVRYIKESFYIISMVAPSIFKPFCSSPRKVHGVHARDILDASLFCYTCRVRFSFCIPALCSARNKRHCISSQNIIFRESLRWRPFNHKLNRS